MGKSNIKCGPYENIQSFYFFSFDCRLSKYERINFPQHLWINKVLLLIFILHNLASPACSNNLVKVIIPCFKYIVNQYMVRPICNALYYLSGNIPHVCCVCLSVLLKHMHIAMASEVSVISSLLSFPLILMEVAPLVHGPKHLHMRLIYFRTPGYRKGWTILW